MPTKSNESDALDIIMNSLVLKFKPVSSLKQGNKTMSTRDFISKINELHGSDEFFESDIVLKLKEFGYQYTMLAPDFEIEWMVLVN